MYVCVYLISRIAHIAQLILPLTTVLDDSIGCALWFAARGKGLLAGTPYTTTARVSTPFC